MHLVTLQGKCFFIIYVHFKNLHNSFVGNQPVVTILEVEKCIGKFCK